jgi:hypothetical protein
MPSHARPQKTQQRFKAVMGNNMSGLRGLRLIGGFNHQVVAQFADVALVVYPTEIEFTRVGGTQVKLKQWVG